LEDLARDALASGEEEAALAQLAPAAENSGNARLWQFCGLLQRALDRHSEALDSFAEASRLDPDDAGIAHGSARVTLEAGLDAVALFERAGRLDPTSGAVLLGLIAAKLAGGRGLEAEAQLDGVLERSPLWIDGHAQLAQLRAMLGKRHQAQSSIERALTAQPNEQSLWAGLFNLALGQEDFAALDGAVARARGAGQPETLTSPFGAIAASELNQADRADRLFETMAPADRDSIANWHVRHLIRTGRAQQAIALIDRELDGPQAEQFWPYASIAWRLVGDPRSDWLDAGDTFVSVFDLADRLPPLGALADVLRSLHVAKGTYLDQSVRGGTQTDGPLLSRLEPEIQALRAVIVEAVSQYRAQLPPHDPKHPLLREPRDRRIRFSGSWSVRLRQAGYHVNHVHPQGWISSALYVALPDRAEGDSATAGWLKLGEAPFELGIDAPPVQRIEPKPGRLVLFPSWMWHGTIPFSQGERLTVAFDVRPPI
jgi:tetratricopeptide (TPR) repeat protein